MTTVAVMGSSGSIGIQTLDIIRAEPERFTVDALGVGSDLETLKAQVDEFRPRLAVIANADRYADAKEAIGDRAIVLAGDDGLREASADADVVINGVMGFAGLAVTMSALEHGRRLGLANKESLIAAGPVVQAVRTTPGAEIIPVDSEHCALHQCLRAGKRSEVEELVLTASGGPFRGRSASELAEVSVDDALAHPTWSMGPKITVDSSTLMNKGLEVIEAHELYGISYDDIDVVVHPQSIVHSMVTFSDGATMAQLSEPDMRLCIGYALTYPDRLDLPYGPIDWTQATTLTFEPPDRAAFPCLDLAFEAGRRGGTAPAWLSAANEIAVDAFLQGLMSWSGIAELNEQLLDEHDGASAVTLGDVLEADARARDRARRRIHGNL